jgi:enolase
MPMVNVISGGAHARGGVAFQDFLAIPVGAESFADALDQAWRVRRATAAVAEERGWTTLVADEGGLGPPLPSNRAALELLAEGIERARVDVAIGIDVAANQLAAPPDLDELERWCAEFPIVSIEDPRGEDDWEGWAELTRRLAPRVQLVGDDLFATSAARLARGIDAGAATAILIKPNQAGTLTDAHEALSRAQEAGYAAVVSARSGDTEDSWLADLAVGWAAGQIKVGSTARSERTAKWNRLLRIEAELGPSARFAGYPAARS